MLGAPPLYEARAFGLEPSRTALPLLSLVDKVHVVVDQLGHILGELLVTKGEHDIHHACRECQLVLRLLLTQPLRVQFLFEPVNLQQSRRVALGQRHARLVRILQLRLELADSSLALLDGAVTRLHRLAQHLGLSSQAATCAVGLVELLREGTLTLALGAACLGDRSPLASL